MISLLGGPFFDEDQIFQLMSNISSTQLLVWTSAFMFLNSSIMTPPSQYVCLAAGAISFHNNSSVLAIVVAATVANFLGTAVWYALGRAGLYRTILSSSIFKHRLTAPYVAILPTLHEKFRSHGLLAMALWRLVPVVRSIVSLPAGDLAVPLPAFTAASLFGIGIWCLFWTILGVLLGRLSPAAAGLAGLALGISAVTIFLVFTNRYPPEAVKNG
jgi:membrane protein DedA with SNARE-associated domain